MRIGILTVALMASLACGDSVRQPWPGGLGADQIFDAANQARFSLRSIDIAGHSPGTGTIEFAFARPGAARATIYYSQARVDMVAINGHYYVRSAKLWAQLLGANPQTRALAQRIDDQWVDIAPAGLNLGTLPRVSDPHFLADCLQLGPHGKLRRAGLTSVDGREAVELDDDGSAPGAAPARWYIATDPPHYFLRLHLTGPRSPGGQSSAPAKCGGTVAATSFTQPQAAGAQLDFLQINRPIAVRAPANSLDISSLIP